ncbi:MAG: DEAD/DEAH box helicase, partial [Acidimicrobiia bacterium]
MADTAVGELTAFLPEVPDADNLLDAFLGFCRARGISLYPHQEEAILELFAGHNVILATPTGSGKSMVALASHFMALGRGQRSWYSAPIKALVSEKFFALCRDLGSDNVGMITGDASINPDAPVICCTAEILANLALRHGADAPAHDVVMDEFHYYGDRSRGWAWQVPLLELHRSRFLLMSATLGDTRLLQRSLSERTGRRTVLIGDAPRPVPLDFEYRETPLHVSIAELIAAAKTPAYLVHFTQAAATEAAQNLMSVDVLTKDEKVAVKAAIGRFRFDSPFGNDLRRFVHHGIGVHHAGMLPKYRLLVEKLAQQGLLKVICGTDTLGVGINVPIRTVLFTQLCKYDGEKVRVLSVRDFQQIAGRAGRQGFDVAGSVWVQAPEHVVENLRLEARAQQDPTKRKKLVKKKPPEFGYAAWNRDTMTRLVEGRPEALQSSFTVTHAMLLELLDRPGDGCAAVKDLLLHNDEPRKAQRRHIRRAIAIYRSLLAAGVLERLDHPDEYGRTIRVNLELQEEFRLNQPLSPFVLEMLQLLDHDADTYPLDVLSVVESVLENPTVVLQRQLDHLKHETLQRLKANGVEYEERMRILADLEWPKPLREPLYAAFNRFRTRHPWVGDENVRPKSVARELFEESMTFREYVGFYGLKRSEGVLLRYLSDVYKTLVQNVPDWHVDDELDELIDWLGETVRGVDSSLLDEWERLRDPDLSPEELAAQTERETGEYDVTANRRAFAVLVRNAAFAWVQALARGDAGRLPAGALEAVAPFFDEFDELRTDPVARQKRWFRFDVDTGEVTQQLVDPDEYGEWRLR